MSVLMQFYSGIDCRDRRRVNRDYRSILDLKHRWAALNSRRKLLTFRSTRDD